MRLPNIEFLQGDEKLRVFPHSLRQALERYVQINGRGQCPGTTKKPAADLYVTPENRQATFIHPGTDEPLYVARYSYGADRVFTVGQQRTGHDLNQGRPFIMKGGAPGVKEKEHNGKMHFTHRYRIWNFGENIEGRYDHVLRMVDYSDKYELGTVRSSSIIERSSPTVVSEGQTSVEHWSESTLQHQNHVSTPTFGRPSPNPTHLRPIDTTTRYPASASGSAAAPSSLSPFILTKSPVCSGASGQRDLFNNAATEADADEDIPLAKRRRVEVNAGNTTESISKAPDDKEPTITFVFKETIDDEHPYRRSFEQCNSLKKLMTVARLSKKAIPGKRLSLVVDDPKYPIMIGPRDETLFEEIIGALKFASEDNGKQIIVLTKS